MKSFIYLLMELKQQSPKFVLYLLYCKSCITKNMLTCICAFTYFKWIFEYIFINTLLTQINNSMIVRSHFSDSKQSCTPIKKICMKIIYEMFMEEKEKYF